MRTTETECEGSLVFDYGIEGGWRKDSKENGVIFFGQRRHLVNSFRQEWDTRRKCGRWRDSSINRNLFTFLLQRERERKTERETETQREIWSVRGKEREGRRHTLINFFSLFEFICWLCSSFCALETLMFGNRSNGVPGVDGWFVW